MLRKGFSLRGSHTKSRFSFNLPDVDHRTLKGRTFFRDPAAIPMLDDISEALRVQGYEVTSPKPGKACHGFCRVIFAGVEISVVMLVARRRGKVEFELLTWPSTELATETPRTEAKVAGLSRVERVVFSD